MMAWLLMLLLTLVGGDDRRRAEAAYRDGRFAEAHELFQSEIGPSGEASGGTLFALGNCAYRLGRYDEALLYYRRAELRLPRYEELLFNRGLVERRLGIEPEPELPWLERLDQWDWLRLTGLLQALGAIGLILCWRQRRLRLLSLVVFAAGLGSGWRLVELRYLGEPPPGIVIAEEIALRAEPHRSVGMTLRLPLGEEVWVLEGSDRWLHIQHRRGSGWTERAGVDIGN